MNVKDIDTLYSIDAHLYDLDPRPVMKDDIPFYIGAGLALEEGKKTGILQLACGNGRITLPLAKAGHEIWALDYSKHMLEVLREKMGDEKTLTPETAGRIHQFWGDMSQFDIGRRFPLILLPARSFQLLLNDEREAACLECIRNHLANDGRFILNIGNFAPDEEGKKVWESKEETEFFDWENRHPTEGYKVRRTHIKKGIDENKQIVYVHKIFRVTDKDGSERRVEKDAAFKYFFLDQIRSLLTGSGFKIVTELGGYRGEVIGEGPEFLFICMKR